MKGFVIGVFSFLAIIFLGHAVYGNSFPSFDSLIHTMESHSISIEDIVEPWQETLGLYDDLESDFESIKEEYYGPYEPWEEPTPGDNGAEMFFNRLWKYLKFIVDVYLNTGFRQIGFIFSSIFALIQSIFILLSDVVWFLVGLSEIFFGVVV